MHSTQGAIQFTILITQYDFLKFFNKIRFKTNSKLKKVSFYFSDKLLHISLWNWNMSNNKTKLKIKTNTQ